MDNYSFLADLLNKFHTSLPWIQFIWIAAISTFLFGLGWCIKDIFIAFAKSIQETVIAFAKKAKPEGELVYTIYRNDEDELCVYCHNATAQQIEGNNVVLLPIGEKPKQINEKPNNDSEENESFEDDDLDGKKGKSI